jgi:hypothetical protein
MNDNVFLALFNPMTEESSFGVLSVHKTHKGAEMAIEFDKEETRKEHEEFLKDRDPKDNFDYGPFDQFKAWAVCEMKLQD